MNPGTRADPHLQARAAREQPLLLHSMAAFREIFERLFAVRPIRTVVEVGVESGQVSSLYAELGAATVHCVEPCPSDGLRETLAGDPRLRLVERPSPDALAGIPPADLYVLDGDHNYATVRAELDWIFGAAPDAVVAVHDVLWPCSRRDVYYRPARPDARPDSPDGPTVWHDGLTPAGFVGADFTYAVEPGGERNGVLTAVEDAVAASGWGLAIVPAVFGMALLAREGRDVFGAVAAYTASPLLELMENNRIALYTRVLQLQYEARAHAADANRLAETVAAHRREIERLRAERGAGSADGAMWGSDRDG